MIAYTRSVEQLPGQATGAAVPARIVAAEVPRPGLLARVCRRGLRGVRQCSWRLRLAEFGARSDICWPAYVVGGRAISLGREVIIWHHARLEAFNAHRGILRISIGDGTNIQPYVHIGAAESVNIGRGVLVASAVYISDHDHDWSDPADPVIANSRVVAAPVEIGDFAWLGERVIVLKGVRIGAHSIIGAGSIVTRDIPPYVVAVGAPARVVRRYEHNLRTWRAVEQP